MTDASTVTTTNLFRIQRHALAVHVGISICTLSLLLLAALPVRAQETLMVGHFSQGQAEGPLPNGWTPLTFDNIEKHTDYRLVKSGKNVVVKATSNAASSGLTREVTIDPAEYPIVQWRWKVENILEHGDVARKEGDDYPARLYITFAYDRTRVGFFEKAKYEAAKLLYGQYPPSGAINYIWESKSPIGTVVPNPYTDRVQMVVVESGGARLQEWVEVERNVYQDYLAAFGEPPPPISGVAIMTDTDNTGESATAYFGDIVFKKTRSEKPAARKSKKSKRKSR